MQRNIRFRLVKLCCIALLALTLTVACHSSSPQSSSGVSEVTSAPKSECRTVEHTLGTVCIPFSPERGVALDPRYVVDPLLSLGIQPIAMSVYNVQEQETLAGLTAEQTADIERVGDTYQPSIEKILSLKPDLILAVEFAHQAIYEQLAAIAPTVLLEYDIENFETYPSIKANLQRLANIFAKEAEAKEVLSEYQSRIDALRQQTGPNPEELEITLLLRYSDAYGLPHPEHTSHEIFSDIGLQDNINETRSDSVSLEVLPEYAPDILLIMDYENNPESFFLDNPIIASLDAVKNDLVYFVDPETWSANGPLGVNKMLDDLFLFLPEKP